MTVDLEAEYGPQIARWTTGLPTVQQTIANSATEI